MTACSNGLFTGKIAMTTPLAIPDEHRTDAIYVSDGYSQTAEEVMQYVLRGIATLSKYPISRWQQVAESNILRRLSLYWFVTDSTGKEIVLGDIPDYGGTNLCSFIDAVGDNVGQDILETAADGGGWIQYYWYIDTTGDGLVQLKLSYVLPFLYKGTLYIIGSGYFPQSMVREYNQSCQAYSMITHCGLGNNRCKDAVDRVGTVVSMLEDQGIEEGISILRGGTRDVFGRTPRFTSDSLYIYIMTLDGRVLYNSLSPELVGTNVSNSPCTRDAFQKIRACGGGWNTCTFSTGGKRLGYDKEINYCPQCPDSDRYIVGTSFDV